MSDAGNSKNSEREMHGSNDHAPGHYDARHEKKKRRKKKQDDRPGFFYFLVDTIVTLIGLGLLAVIIVEVLMMID